LKTPPTSYCARKDVERDPSRGVALKQSRIVIVGGGVAGLSAAASAREIDNLAEIVVLSKEPHPPYCRLSLPSAIATSTSRVEDFVLFSSWISNLGIHFLPGTNALDVDPDERVIRAENVKTRERLDFSYDDLVFATGSSAFIPQIEGVEKKGVFSLRTFNDALKISQHARAGKSAVVVGAGFVGLKVAEALVKRGMKVIITVRSRILRELIEPSFSLYLKKHIERKGAKVLTGVSPKEIGGGKRVEYIRLDDEKVPASIVVFATGVVPNVDIAMKAGVKLGKTGAIKVNRRMQTSIPEIYAAGDCTEALDALTDEWTYFPLGSVAAEEGAIAGKNAAGMQVDTKGIIRSQMDSVFGNEIVSIGHTSEVAKEMGVTAESIPLLSTENRFSFLRQYPAKITTVINTRQQIIGAQIISYRFASTYAFDILSAIKKRVTLSDFLERWQPLPSALTALTPIL